MKSKFKKRVEKKWVRVTFYLFAWIGVAVIYYIIFSLFFDTPIEYELRKTNKQLSEQYDSLYSRYNDIVEVFDNIEERDKNVYSLLFESNPYSNVEAEETIDVEELLAKTNNELSEIFFDKLESVTNRTVTLSNEFNTLQKDMISQGDKLDYIPAIQPVVNKELTRLAASYGQRIHPFYKNMVSHQGVDYAVPEDTRVFATADGRVSDVTTNADGKGLVVVLDHGNGYKTTYAHLSKSVVKKGQSIRRGDIIAHSGNSGMSFMPHLHYEVSLKGRRVDPINYFFMELNHKDNVRINEIAQIGMQSLD